jgi:hypothetical protein
MASLSPNLSMPVNQRRGSCVLDPNLILSQYGWSLVQSLGTTLELWVARELWHIVDNPISYLQRPESILPHTVLKKSSKAQAVTSQQVIRGLKNWASIRAGTYPANLNLFWVGDSPRESFFPSETDPQLMERWEALANSLDTRLIQQSITSHVLAAAIRDTAALAAALEPAFILTYQPTHQPTDQPADNHESTHSSPEICLTLEQWGIPCRQIDPLDAIATIEREALLQLIIATGFSKFLWAGLHLVVLHLVVPSATSYDKIQLPETIYSFNEASDLEASLLNCWEGAQGFWYRL